MCSNNYFHAYHDPLLAVLLNPIHAYINNPRLFKVLVDGESKDDKGLKCGYKSMTLVEELELPEITSNQKIAFGILCALEVYKEPKFVSWAENWLDGSDGSDNAARAARAAYAAAADDDIDLISIAQKAMDYN